MRRYLLAGLVTFAVGSTSTRSDLDQQEHCTMQVKQVFQESHALKQHSRTAGHDFQRVLSERLVPDTE
jgi:hypothetical protein